MATQPPEDDSEDYYDLEDYYESSDDEYSDAFADHPAQGAGNAQQPAAVPHRQQNQNIENNNEMASSYYPLGSSPPVPPQRVSSLRGRSQNAGNSLIREPLPGLGTRGMQCTHMTMVRFYARDFECSVCKQTGAFGWLYRCTQDRDIMLDNDLEGAKKSSIDSIFDIVGVSSDPKLKSPAARADPMSYINEMSAEQLGQYTHTQLNTLFNQRANVLHVANLHTQQHEWLNHRLRGALDPRYNSHNRKGLVPHIQNPWDVMPEMECQFKCCPRCRQSSKDRSFVSLNAVCNGEVPLTAATGFGFVEQRPVMLIKHALNFGMRPNPAPKTADEVWEDILNLSRSRSLPTPPLPPASERKITPPERAITPFDDPDDIGTTFGQEGSNAYDNSSMVRKHSLEVHSGQEKDRRRLPTDPLPEEEEERLYLRWVLNTQDKKVLKATEREGWDIRLPPPKELEMLLEEMEHGSPQSARLRRAISLRAPMRRRTSVEKKRFRRSADLSTLSAGLSDAAQAGSVLSGSRSQDNLLQSSDPLTIWSSTPPRPSSAVAANGERGEERIEETDMERHEREDHEFGAEPLRVGHGVAVTEEAVEQHIPDVIVEERR